MIISNKVQFLLTTIIIFPSQWHPLRADHNIRHATQRSVTCKSGYTMMMLMSYLFLTKAKGHT